MQQMIKTGHTETTHGAISHLILGGGELRAPVKLSLRKGEVTRTLSGQYSRTPLVRQGRYVHALPGGGEALGSYVSPPTPGQRKRAA